MENFACLNSKNTSHSWKGNFFFLWMKKIYEIPVQLIIGNRNWLSLITYVHLLSCITTRRVCFAENLYEVKRVVYNCLVVYTLNVLLVLVGLSQNQKPNKAHLQASRGQSNHFLLSDRNHITIMGMWFVPMTAYQLDSKSLPQHIFSELLYLHNF